MSADALQVVIGKAATDSAFRQRLEDDFDDAVAEFELDDEEKDALKNSMGEIEAFSAKLDQRITKGFSNMG